MKEKKIHYGFVLRCSPQPFSCLDLWALLYIDAPAGWGGEAFHSLSVSALKISEGKENEFEKREEKGGERRDKNTERMRDGETVGLLVSL